MTNANHPRAPWTALLLVLALGGAAAASAQVPSAAPGGVKAVIEAKPSAEANAPAAAAGTGAAAAQPTGAPPGLAQLAWLEGCWRGVANDREFREHWLPLRGDLLVGVSHTVMEGKTVGFEYLR